MRASRRSRRPPRKKKDNPLLLGLLQFLVDAVAYLCVSILVAIGLGYLVVIGRFLYDLARGARDPVAATVPDADLPHVLLQIPVFNEPLVMPEGAESLLSTRSGTVPP